MRYAILWSIRPTRKTGIYCIFNEKPFGKYQSYANVSLPQRKLTTLMLMTESLNQ